MLKLKKRENEEKTKTNKRKESGKRFTLNLSEIGWDTANDKKERKKNDRLQLHTILYDAKL